MDYKVKLNSGEIIDLKNTTINVETLTSELNNQREAFINIGNLVISKHIIAGVFPKETVEGELANENQE